MLDAGVDINQVDVDGTNALIFSIMNQRYSFAKFLLERGADPNLSDVKGRGALYAAVDIRNEDYSAMPSRKEDDPLPSLEIVKDLLAHGAKLDTPVDEESARAKRYGYGRYDLGQGATPLMRAARAGDSAVMRLLLEKGADPKLTTKDGNTAFMFAAGVGYRDKNTRGTESEALEALKVAFAQGPDINQANTKGETALHGAADRGADTIVQFLVDHGAKLDAKTKQGLTPLDVAMGKNSFAGLPVPHDSTVALIKKLGGVEAKGVKQASLK